MGYLTFNTRSNRVAIISSVIDILTLCNTWTVTFQPVSIKTLVIYLCCAYCACASYIFVIITRYLFICAHYSLLSFIYFVHCSTLYLFCGSISFSSIPLFYHSLFIVSKRKVQFWSWTVFRYFDPVQVQHHESINIIQQTPPTLS